MENLNSKLYPNPSSNPTLTIISNINPNPSSNLTLNSNLNPSSNPTLTIISNINPNLTPTLTPNSNLKFFLGKTNKFSYFTSLLVLEKTNKFNGHFLWFFFS